MAGSYVLLEDYNMSMDAAVKRCRSGLHDMTTSNTYVRPNGYEICRACIAISDAKRFAPGQMCCNGHELTDATVRITPGGRRHCLECEREYDRPRTARLAAERAANRPRRLTRREWNLKRYGLTLESYNALLADQGGVCAICATDQPGGRWNTHFVVDHDHALGHVRGLLCSHCNVMLGNANDEPDRLRAAADYLENA